MSTLWTPGGEVPVDREPDRGDEPADEEAQSEEARYEEAQRRVLDAPAAEVVAQHAAALYELAALHLTQEEPRLADARLAIDALSALLEGLAGRLGPAEEPLSAALPQLKMAYVEAADRPARAGA